MPRSRALALAKWLQLRSSVKAFSGPMGPREGAGERAPRLQSCVRCLPPAAGDSEPPATPQEGLPAPRPQRAGRASYLRPVVLKSLPLPGTTAGHHCEAPL